MNYMDIVFMFFITLFGFLSYKMINNWMGEKSHRNEDLKNYTPKTNTKKKK